MEAFTLFLQTVSVVCCVGLVALVTDGIFGGAGGGVKMYLHAWFGWHPVLMTLSFGCLMPLGRYAYLAPAGTCGLQSLPQRRNAHNLLMALAVLAMLGGYLAIFAAHLPIKKFFGYSFEVQEWASKPRVVHSLLGYLVLLLALAQALMGQAKRFLLESKGARIFTFHGTLGKAIMVLGAFNIAVAIHFWMWNYTMKACMYAFTVGSVLVGATLTSRPASKPGEEQRLVPDGGARDARSVFNPAPTSGFKDQQASQA